jgi:hypothetical protein
MGRAVLIAILMLAASHSASGQNARPSSTPFHWLNSGKDATLFERIKTAFLRRVEARRSRESKTGRRAGVQVDQPCWGLRNTSALVLIGERDFR